MGFSALLIGSPTRPMTSSEVEVALSRHWKQPCALVLELPERELGGACIEWDELCAIKALCAKRDIKLHLDGARLWEAQSYYRRSLQEICSLFDSVYVSFYKVSGKCTTRRDGACIRRCVSPVCRRRWFPPILFCRCCC